MRLVFVHGWSATTTNTYGGLPQALAAAARPAGPDLDIQHLYLGRYISFHDEVSLDDISRAMQQALIDLPGNSSETLQPFACITHSTGGPVVRHWIDRFYGASGLDDLPLTHLVMLAPANHGSALAALGKERVGRIKSWMQGVEPGQRVLEWLCLGSDGQWNLNKNTLDYSFGATTFFSFVLTGQGIDRHFYDFLNNYLVENGSDGVVRVAAANVTCRFFSVAQSNTEIIRKSPLTLALHTDKPVRVTQSVPLGVYNDYSHSGIKTGIMASIKPLDPDALVVQDILKCFSVRSDADYRQCSADLAQLTKTQQADNNQYCMLVVTVRDDQGETIKKNEYDLILLAGKKYLPKTMPDGFLKDRQMNEQSGRLVYYLDARKMNDIQDGCFGFRVTARPTNGFSYYCAAEFRSNGTPVSDVLTTNQTTYLDITLRRFVDKNVFRFDPASNKRINFKKLKPDGTPIDS